MKTELYRSFEGKLDVGNEEGYIIYSIGRAAACRSNVTTYGHTARRSRSAFRQNSCRRRTTETKQRSPNFA